MLGTLKAALIGLACSVLAGGFGYIIGEGNGRKLERADQIAAAESIRQNDATVRAEIAASQREQGIKNAQTEVENDAIQETLSVPEAGDSEPFASADWVRQFGRLH